MPNLCHRLQTAPILAESHVGGCLTPVVSYKSSYKSSYTFAATGPWGCPSHPPPKALTASDPSALKRNASAPPRASPSASLPASPPASPAKPARRRHKGRGDCRTTGTSRRLARSRPCSPAARSRSSGPGAGRSPRTRNPPRHASAPPFKPIDRVVFFAHAPPDEENPMQTNHKPMTVVTPLANPE